MSFEAVNTVTNKSTTPAVDVNVLPLQNELLSENSEENKLNKKGIYIQPKLTVGAPDDPYEKEADAMADKVMRMPQEDFAQCKETDLGGQEKLQRKSEEDKQIHLRRNSTDSFIQRQCAECGKEEKLQRKHEDDDKKIQLKIDLSGAFIQKKCAACDDEKKEKIHRKPLSQTITPFIQTKSNGESSIGNTLSSSIENSRGRGSTLDSHTRSFMEKNMGADFSSVKIHTGNESAQMNKELNAKAFTVGSDVYFNEGKYQPNSDAGKKLLAHELTHVVQQNKVNTTNEKIARKAERGTYTYNLAPLYEITNDLQWFINYIRGQIDLIVAIEDDTKKKVTPELIAATSVLVFINNTGLQISEDNEKAFMLEVLAQIKGFGDELPERWFRVSFDVQDLYKYFNSNVLLSYIKSLRSKNQFSIGELIAADDFSFEEPKDETPAPQKWMEELNRNVKPLIEETKSKEPASIDLPDKNVKLYYDKKESKWKLRAYQKEKGKEATHFVFVDLKEDDTKEKLLERTRQAIRKEIANDYKNTVTVDGQKQTIDPKFKWAFHWIQKLREAMAADRKKSRGEVILPDVVSLTRSSTEPDNIYVSISVFVDNRMLLDDVTKIEKDIQKIRVYSDDVSYTPPYGVGVTMKSGTIPKPLQQDLDPQHFLDFYVRPYTEALLNRYNDQKNKKDESHQYTRVLKPYPAYIKPVNVRPDFQSVTGASQSFHMVVDITQTEGTDNISSLVFFNPVYYKWRMYRVTDLLSADELSKFSADWEIMRVQLLAYFKERAQIKTGPIENEKAMAQRKIVEATFPGSTDSKPMFYGDSGLEPDGYFTLPDQTGDYLVYCSAQFEPFDDTIQIPSEAFFPIRLREGYDLAQETLIKYRNPELVKLEKELSETTDASQIDVIKQKISVINSTTLRDATDENKSGSKIGDANERIRIAKRLEELYNQWNKENDKSISNDLDFKLLLSKDGTDGKALIELWTNVIKRRSGYVAYNIKKYIEQQGDSIKGIKALHSRIAEFDDDIDYTKPIYTPSLILISNETGQEYQLISMLGIEKKSIAGERFGRVILIDFSTGDTQKAYYSDTFIDKETATEQDFINAAPQAFEDFAGTCKYGEGYIAYEVPGLANVHGLLSGECSTGQKFLNVLGKLAMVAGIAALVLGTIATGGALGVVAAGLGIASAVIGAALSAKNIADRIGSHRFEFDVEFALDVINIIGPLTMGAGALARASKLGMIDRGIADIAQLSKLQGLVKLEQGIALYQKVEMGTNFILTNYKLIEDLNKIDNMNIPEEQKAVLREELIANGLIGNLMFATSVAHEYAGRTSADAQVEKDMNARIMAIDLTAYKEANIKSGIYTSEGEFNSNIAKDKNIPETVPEKVNVDENVPPAVPTEATKTAGEPTAATPTEPSSVPKSNDPVSTHEVSNTATHQTHEHKIAENGAITRCTEHCLPLSLDMSARAKAVKKTFDKEHPNNKKATELSDTAGKLEAESRKAASLRDKIKQKTEEAALLKDGTKQKTRAENALVEDKAKLKTKEDEIYSKADELERSMAQLESEMVTTLDSRSAGNVSDLKDLFEKYPDQKKRFEKKLNDLDSTQKEASKRAADPDPETSKKAWNELAAIDKDITKFKGEVDWEIENLARPDISETYKYQEYTSGNGDKVKSAKGELGVPGKVREVREGASQKAVSEGTGDDAGHLIANIFGGAGDERNLGGQNFESNRFGTWKELENYWSDKLKNGTKIFVEVKEATKPGENRPYRRVAEWTEIDASGNVTNHDLDFVNTHTQESRGKQNIPATPDIPAAGAEVFIWNAERAKRGLPEYHGE